MAYPVPPFPLVLESVGPSPRHLIVGFHGTDQLFERFKPSARGSFGAGIYAADRAAAVEYAGPGGYILEVGIHSSNPYRYAASFDHDLDFDSAAVGLIRTILPANADCLLESSMCSDGLFGSEVKEALEGMGYDSLLVTYEDGSCEVVAFHPERVVIRHRSTLPA